MVVQPEKKMIFIVLYTDLIDYFVVCYEHKCNTMRVFKKKKQLNYGS